jgi:hypothetical protein
MIWVWIWTLLLCLTVSTKVLKSTLNNEWLELELQFEQKYFENEYNVMTYVPQISRAYANALPSMVRSDRAI